MTLHIYKELDQGTPEWLNARCGILTASVIGHLITTKTLKPANNDTARALVMTLAAERITGYVEPMRETDDMRRGTLDEPYARDKYAEHFGPVEELGFMVRDDWGYKIGYSPDGLVGDDGLIEIKSRRQKKHLATILANEVPAENMAQIQTGLLVSGRKWCDYVSYSGGMKLWTKRVLPDPKWFEVIKEAAGIFEMEAFRMINAYEMRTLDAPDTERIDHYLDLELKL